MTDKELAMLLTESLDQRIARAESAPVIRADQKRMPPAELLSGSVVQAVPARRLRWKGVAAAVLALVLLGGVVLAGAKLTERKSPNRPAASGQAEDTRTDTENTARDTEPDRPAELPQVVYDADGRTIRITGTGGYDQLELSPYLDDALSLELEDDSFRLTVVLSVIESYTDQAHYDFAGYLAGYLDRLDRSLAFVGRYIAEHAPSEEIVAQTRKPVEILITGQRNSFTSIREDRITLSLANGFRHHGVLYAMSLIDSETMEWQQLGYAYWVAILNDPYNSIYAGGSFEEDRDYYYFSDYFRLGGTADPLDLNNQALLVDANAWYNLVYGRDWDGNDAECKPISALQRFRGDPGKEGNDMCLVEAESLLNYLSGQYGPDSLAAFCLGACSFEEAFGTDFAAAHAAWEQSLLERFGDGGEREP